MIRHAAYACASRLLKRPDVQAARQWYYAQSNGEIPRLPMPPTMSGILEVLQAFGSGRAKIVGNARMWMRLEAVGGLEKQIPSSRYSREQISDSKSTFGVCSILRRTR
jgi:hypothetical protein